MNGNNYITDSTITTDILSDDNLSSFTINDETYTNMTCPAIWTEDNQTRFILIELLVEEIIQKAVNSSNDDITNIQLAIASLYEIITQGV